MEPGKKGQVQGEAGWGTPGRTLTFLLVLLCLGKKKGWECVSGATSGPACEGVGPKEPAGARGRGHNTGFRGASETPEASALWGRAASRGRGAQSSGGQATPTTRSAGWGLAGSGFRWDLRNEEASGTTLGEGGLVDRGSVARAPPERGRAGASSQGPPGEPHCPLWDSSLPQGAARREGAASALTLCLVTVGRERGEGGLHSACGGFSQTQPWPRGPRQAGATQMATHTSSSDMVAGFPCGGRGRPRAELGAGSVRGCRDG